MKNYFYIDSNNAQQGPVPAERLLDYGVKANTMVWADGMANWTEAGQVDELAPLFAPKVPPTPQAQPQPQPQQQAQYSGAQQTTTPIKPDNNLVWALLCTFLCCQIFGIISIVKACEVDGKWNRGDYAGAIESAAAAKKWAMWGAIAGGIVSIIIIIFYIIYFSIMGAAAMSNL